MSTRAITFVLMVGRRVDILLEVVRKGPREKLIERAATHQVKMCIQWESVRGHVVEKLTILFC